MNFNMGTMTGLKSTLIYILKCLVGYRIRTRVPSSAGPVLDVKMSYLIFTRAQLKNLNGYRYRKFAAQLLIANLKF